MGTDGGISYLDINVAGTATANTASVVFFDSTVTDTPATSAQTWSLTTYIKTISGTVPHGFTLGWYNYDSSSTYLNSQQVLNGLTSTSSWTRPVATAPPSNASTAYIRPYIFAGTLSGETVNFTYRIGMPQLELGAFPTSVIPTYTTAVTRAADTFTVPTAASGTNGAWYNASANQGTLLVNGILPYSFVSGSPPRWAGIDDGVGSYLVQFPISVSGTSPQLIYGGSGTYVSSFSNGTGILVKMALAYTSGSVNSAVNGSLGGASTTTSIPTGLTTLAIGNLSYTPRPLNGWVNRLTYFPIRQPDYSLTNFTQ
jgi:hypothetical protein